HIRKGRWQRDDSKQSYRSRLADSQSPALRAVGGVPQQAALRPAADANSRYWPIARRSDISARRAVAIKAHLHGKERRKTRGAAEAACARPTFPRCRRGGQKDRPAVPEESWSSAYPPLAFCCALCWRSISGSELRRLRCIGLQPAIPAVRRLPAGG